MTSRYSTEVRQYAGIRYWMSEELRSKIMHGMFSVEPVVAGHKWRIITQSQLPESWTQYVIDRPPSRGNTSMARRLRSGQLALTCASLAQSAVIFEAMSRNTVLEVAAKQSFRYADDYVERVRTGAVALPASTRLTDHMMSETAAGRLAPAELIAEVAGLTIRACSELAVSRQLVLPVPGTAIGDIRPWITHDMAVIATPRA